MITDMQRSIDSLRKALDDMYGKKNMAIEIMMGQKKLTEKYHKAHVLLLTTIARLEAVTIEGDLRKLCKDTRLKVCEIFEEELDS